MLYTDRPNHLDASREEVTADVTRSSRPSSQLRFGVIGYGLRGDLVATAHRPALGQQVVALAEIDESRWDVARHEVDPHLDCLHDYRDLLTRPDIDAVFILSPDWLHEEHATAVLRAGKAVYLEKPMAITIEGCDRILQTARVSGAKLYVGHNMRHFPFTLAMKNLIDQGAIGEVQTAWARHFISYGGDAYFKDWHADKSKSTGLLLQKGTHDLDVLHWLCGGHSVRVQAMGRLSVYNQVTDRLQPGEPYEGWDENRWSDGNWPPLAARKLNPIVDVEDVSLLNAQLDNGTLISYMQCHFTPDNYRNYTVIGTHGRIENVPSADGGHFIKLWNKRSDIPRPDGDEQISLPPGAGSHEGADHSTLAEFVAYLRGEHDPGISPVDARHAVACAYTATQSLRGGGRALDIPPFSSEVDSRSAGKTHIQAQAPETLA